MSESSPFRTSNNHKYIWPPETVAATSRTEFERVTHVKGLGEPQPWRKGYERKKMTDLLVNRAGDIVTYMITCANEAPETFSLDQEWWNETLNKAHQWDVDQADKIERWKNDELPWLKSRPAAPTKVRSLLRLTPMMKFTQYFKVAADIHTNDAATYGTNVHHVAEELGRGNSITYDTSLEPGVKNAKRFLTRYSPRFTEIESVVYSERFGYAGQFDFIAKIPIEVMLSMSVFDPTLGARGEYVPWTDKRDKDAAVYDPNFITVWGDYKTHVKDGIALQLAAYYNADFIGRVDGTRSPIPHVDEFWGVEFGGPNLAVYPINVTDQTFQDFLHVRGVAAWMTDHSKYAMSKPHQEIAA